MKTSKIFYIFSMKCARSSFMKKYGKDIWEKFAKRSERNIDEILPKIPKIGNSIFSSSYEFAPCYIAWYKALKELGFTDKEAGECIWLINDKMISALPDFTRKVYGKIYYSSFRKKSSGHMAKQSSGELHPYDWSIAYREVSKNVFEIDVLSCGLKKLARDFDADGMFPYLCRMDYLFADRLHCGFERTKTLGDGNECCNCRFIIGGSCKWNPDRGFEDRK